MTPADEETPFGERLRREADEIVARYPDPRSALLPMLHLVQSEQGYVSPAGMRFCAARLDLAEAEVAAVASFYTMYKRAPCGRHLVSVCTNTLCAAMGGETVYQRLREHLGFGGVAEQAGGHRGDPRTGGHEETAGPPGEPGSVTLERAECLAACDFAPVLQVNYEYFDNQTPDSAIALVDALRADEPPEPTRGAPLRDFRAAERQLAGFFDGDNDLESLVDAPSQAPETVRGVELAERNDWSAPPTPDEAPIPELEEN